MQRIPEPELMDDPVQAEAYAAADFDEAHSRIVAAFEVCFPDARVAGRILDLGCGPGDISCRFAARYPACTVIGLDGSSAMIRLANRRRADDVAGERVRFVEGLLPDAPIPDGPYAAIVSNSLLHHLHRPEVLWQAIDTLADRGTCIYVADLRRPQDADAARRLVREYAADEPEILQRDFYNSLLAAFTPAEVEAQLAAAGLAGLRVEVISDRHLLLHGTR
jgi:SAM-dependent methyltransferase